MTSSKRHKLLLWYAVAAGTHVLFAVNPALRFSRDEAEHWMRRRLSKHADDYAVEDDAGFLYVASLSLYLWITGYEHDNVCKSCGRQSVAGPTTRIGAPTTNCEMEVA
jgi:hypothetical protein